MINVWISLLFSLLSLPLRRLFVFFERFFSCVLSSLLSTESSIFERPTTHVWATYHYLRIRVHLNTLALYCKIIHVLGLHNSITGGRHANWCLILGKRELELTSELFELGHLLGISSIIFLRLFIHASCCDVSKAFYQYLYQRDLIWDIWFINIQVSSFDF